MTRRRIALLTGLSALAWAGAGLLSVALLGGWVASPPPLVGRALMPVFFGQLAVWGLGGLLTALLLARTSQRFTWNRVLLAALGWAFAGPLRWEVRVAAAGLITVLLLRRASRAVRWPRGLAILAGWALAWALPFYGFALIKPTPSGPVGTAIIAALHGALFGAVGGGVMFVMLRGAGWGSERHAGALRRRVAGMLRLLETSPVMARLHNREVDRQLYTLLIAIFLLGVMALLLSMTIWQRVRQTIPVQGAAIPLIIYLVTLAPTVRSPLVVAAITALLAAADADRQRFELLRLTLISDREVAWAYTVAPLQLARGLLTFEYIVMLLMLVGASCAFLPGFLNAGNQLVLGMLAGLLMMSIGLLGMNVVAAAVGMRVAFWWRDASVATVLALIFTLMLVILALVAAVDGLRMMAVQPSMQVLIGFLFLMIAPYAFALELMDTAQPWPAARDV